MIDTVDSLIAEPEGFKPKPYPDPLTGKEPFTFGHGLTYITEDESKMILEKRANEIKSYLRMTYAWFNKLSFLRQGIIISMVFQLGEAGFHAFKNTRKYLENEDYKNAAAEMLDSKWFREMHELDMKNGKDGENRAEWLSWMMEHNKFKKRDYK